MMHLKAILLVFAIYICVNAVEADLDEEDLLYLGSVFEHIPAEQRKYVLLHQLYLGYIQENPSVTPKDWDISTEDTKKIYDLLLNKMKIKENENKLKAKICFPNGDCIDTDDSGIYPVTDY